MLKELEALFLLAERINIQHPILGWLLMGGVGGLIATVRMYERAGVQFTWRMFAARVAAKGVVGLFVAACVYFGWKASGLNQDWGLLVAGLCGVFGTDVLEAVLVLGWDFLRKRAGLEAKVLPRSDEKTSER